MNKIILVVDDSNIDSLLMDGLLSSYGYTVVTAGNGKQALKKLGEWSIDLVLTDLQMPIMDGLELVRKIRDQELDVPVILTTGSGSEEIAVEALSSGAAGYIPKNKLNAMLKTTVDGVLGILQSDRSYEHLLEHSKGSRFKFKLTNDARLRSELVDFCERMLHSVSDLDRIERLRIAIAIDQAMHNALYRGNLEIDSEHKIGFGHNAESELASERLESDQFADRRINVIMEIKPEYFAISIKDDGPGFDTSAVGTWDDPSMRGVILMNSFMDKVTFNEKGNKVEMVYKFNRKLKRQESALPADSKRTAHIVCVSTGQSIDLTFDKFIVGRRRGAHLKLSSETVAAIHCSFNCSEGRWALINLSDNKKFQTMVNGEFAYGAKLKSGDVVTIGNREFKFEN